MNVSVLYGLLLIGLGAFSSGSFAMPFVKVKQWKWETYWTVFSFSAYILLPLICGFIFVPSFLNTYSEISSFILWKVFFFGAIYGIGNLSFGLSIRYLGLSLGYALSLGLMLAIGTLIPPLIDGRFSDLVASENGNLLFWGIGVAIVGIGLVAVAGYMKDKSRESSGHTNSIKEYNFVKGVLSALLVGVTGSALSLGIEQGQPISDFAIRNGADPLFAINPILLPLLSGTMLTTLIWCIWQGFKGKSLKEYTSVDSSSVLSINYLYCILAGLLWFSQLFLYGMGKSYMGKFNFVAWGILMALTIVCATLWGVIRGEWKGISKLNYVILISALLVIILASFLIGISG